MEFSHVQRDDTNKVQKQNNKNTSEMILSTQAERGRYHRGKMFKQVGGEERSIYYSAHTHIHTHTHTHHKNH